MIKKDAFVFMKRAIDCKPNQNITIFSSVIYIIALVALFLNKERFPSFYLKQNRPENVFHDILESTNAFPDYKNDQLKSRKIVIFPKRLVHGFVKKLAIFPNFFLRQYTRGKCILRYSRTQKRLFRL